MDIFEFNLVMKFNSIIQMQQRVDSKTKLTQYCSVKDLNIHKEGNKKTSKINQGKNNNKSKNTKIHTQSQSKTKTVSNKHTKPNQNFNSLNLAVEAPMKRKYHKQEGEYFKKQEKRQEKSHRNSTQRLVKSKSAVRLHAKSTRVSPSPIVSRDIPDDRAKTYRNITSRAQRQKKMRLAVNRNKEDKQFLKKSGSVSTFHVKKQNTQRFVHNRVSIKTQISSKMNSVIREDQKNRKIKRKQKTAITKKESLNVKAEPKKIYLNKKEKKSRLEAKIQRSILYSDVSFQDYIEECPYQSQLLCSDKIYVSNPSHQKIKTQGCRIQISENYYETISNREHTAALTIQKHFRGYITRKYIDQAKFLIGKAVVLQRWWRSVMTHKIKKNNKPLSIQSSLITIKDFNETLKGEKGARHFSDSKQNTLSTHKLHMKDLIKNILEEQVQSQHSLDKQQNSKARNMLEECSSPCNKSFTKQVYIEGKIQGEIYSEKIFNSPKCLGSPIVAKTPTNLNFGIKEFFNNSNQKQKIKEIMHSPRVNSPQAPAPRATPLTQNKQGHQFEIYPTPVLQVQSFETSFPAIQQFCLQLVGFFKQRSLQFKELLRKITSFSSFRTKLILKNWNSYKLVSQSFLSQDNTLPLDYQTMELYQRPSIFSQKLRQQIITFPEIEIQLNNRRLDLESSRNKGVHRCFLSFIFDVLQQAIYHPFKHFVIEWKGPLQVIQFRNEENLFENVLSTALGQLFSWAQVMCGPIYEGVDEQIMEQQRQARDKVMERRLDTWDMGIGSRLGVKIEVSEQVVEHLVEQFAHEMFQKLYF